MTDLLDGGTFILLSLFNRYHWEPKWNTDTRDPLHEAPLSL